jgi:hypothetical protein
MMLCLRDSISTGDMLGGAGRPAKVSIVSVVKWPSITDVSMVTGERIVSIVLNIKSDYTMFASARSTLRVGFPEPHLLQSLDFCFACATSLALINFPFWQFQVVSTYQWKKF